MAESRSISVRFDSETVDRLEKAAKARGRKLREHIRELCLESLDQHHSGAPTGEAGEELRELGLALAKLDVELKDQLGAEAARLRALLGTATEAVLTAVVSNAGFEEQEDAKRWATQWVDSRLRGQG